MGEKDAAKSGAEEKKADAGGPVVLKLDMHCEGCAKKIKRAVRHLDGVDKVSADVAGNKLTVTGTVDPAKVKERVEEKTGKKVEIVSPQPKKGGGGGEGGDKKKTDEKSEKKSDEKSEKKSDDKKAEDKKPKELAVNNVVLKTPLHCDGCRRKIKRTIWKIKGVDLISMDEEKNLVTVKGTMDPKNLLSYLKERLRESVDIVQPKKEEGGGDKKGKGGEGGSGGDKKKDGGDGKKGEETKVEANKMDYYGYSPYSSYYTMPVHNQGYIDHGYGVPVYDQGYVNPGYNHGYVVEYSHPPPPPPPPTYLQGPPQMFSDENPNACSVM